MALKLDILANTRQFVGEMKKAGASAEDIEDALDELKRQGVKDLEGIEKQLKEVSKQGKKTGKEVGDGLSRGAHEGFNDFKDESRSTATEVAASFDGSAESIAGGFQELAANAFAGFGPAGAAAGIAAAAGLGAVMTAIQAQDEALNQLREKFSSVYQSAAEDGRAYLDEAQIQAGVLDLLFDSTDNFAKRKDAEKEAKLLGLDLITVARARAGSEEEINKIIATGTEKAREMHDAQKEQSGTTSILAAGVQNVVTKYEDQLRLQHELSGVAAANAAAQKASQEKQRAEVAKTRAALESLWKKPVKATVQVSVEDKTQARVDSIVRKINARNATIGITARTLQ